MGPVGPSTSLCSFWWRLPCYPYYWRPGSQRTLDSLSKENTLSPPDESLCGPPQGVTPKPFHFGLLWPFGPWQRTNEANTTLDENNCELPRRTTNTWRQRCKQSQSHYMASRGNGTPQPVTKQNLKTTSTHASKHTLNGNQGNLGDVRDVARYLSGRNCAREKKHMNHGDRGLSAHYMAPRRNGHLLWLTTKMHTQTFTFCFKMLVLHRPVLTQQVHRLGHPAFVWRPRKVGIYGLALNPKRWKFGWPPAKRQVGAKERRWPNSLGQRGVCYTISITSNICRHPHTLQVWWWRHQRMRLIASRDWDALNPKP